MLVRTSSPLTATLSCAIFNLSAILSVNPGNFPPPPTTNTALTGLSPLSSHILSAISSAILVSCVSRSLCTSAAGSLCDIPMISLYVIVFFLPAASLIFSADAKSTKYSLAIISVSSSPAAGIIPYAAMLPSLVRQISEVPAPTSTSAIFRSLYCSGIATFIAAIGSNVRLATVSPA